MRDSNSCKQAPVGLQGKQRVSPLSCLLGSHLAVLTLLLLLNVPVSVHEAFSSTSGDSWVLLASDSGQNVETQIGSS